MSIRKRLEGWKAKLLTMAGKICLIKSVLSSIPIHTLAVLPVSHTMLGNIERIFANFLWNFKLEGKHHWVSWIHICKPLAEGGLGIRPLTQVMGSLHAKLAWNFLQGKSLWAKFMQNKYKARWHHNFLGNNHSHCWKAIFPLLRCLQDNTSLVLGNGLGSFWHSMWHPDFPGYDIHNPPTRLDICIKDAMADTHYIDYVTGYLNMEIHNIISSISLEPAMLDTLVWKGSTTGSFNSGVFWQATRTKFPLVQWHKHTWNTWLPPKISVFMWKLLHNAIPVDENIRRLNMPVVSKCSCCVNPQSESISHLFVSGDLAQKVWSYFSARCNMQCDFHSLQNLLASWWSHNSFRSQVSFTKSVLVSCICWEIWKQRNLAFFEGIPCNSAEVNSKLQSLDQRYVTNF